MPTGCCNSTHLCFRKHVWITSGSVGAPQRWHSRTSGKWSNVSLTLHNFSFGREFNIDTCFIAPCSLYRSCDCCWSCTKALSLAHSTNSKWSVFSFYYYCFTFLKALPGINIRISLCGPRFSNTWINEVEVFLAERGSGFEKSDESKRYGGTERASV